MALIEGKATSTPSARQSVPDDTHRIRERLQSLSQDISACQAEQLALLVRFDELLSYNYRLEKIEPHLIQWAPTHTGRHHEPAGSVSDLTCLQKGVTGCLLER